MDDFGGIIKTDFEKLVVATQHNKKLMIEVGILKSELDEELYENKTIKKLRRQNKKLTDENKKLVHYILENKRLKEELEKLSTNSY